MLRELQKQDNIAFLLDSIRLSCDAFYYVEFGGQWAVQLPESGMAAFHFVDKGAATFHTVAGDWTSLEEGDLIFLPGGATHRIASNAYADAAPLDQLPTLCVEKPGTMMHVFPGGPVSAAMLCGLFQFKEPLARLLFSTLPGRVIFKHSKRAEVSKAIGDLLHKATLEANQKTDYSRLILNRLVELAFRLMLRDWLENVSPFKLGALCALSVPGLGEAIQSILEDPFYAWTLDSLGARAKMSRSAFSEAFREEVGITLLRFVKEIRLERAEAFEKAPNTLKQILADQGHSIQHFFRELRKRQER